MPPTRRDDKVPLLLLRDVADVLYSVLFRPSVVEQRGGCFHHSDFIPEPHSTEFHSRV